MLPDIDLDSEQFDQILERARNTVAGIYPEWTDFNYHDPGITILEMLAWLKEMQQYSLNRIGDDNIIKYLKLVGIRRRTKKPSETQVKVIYMEDVIVAKGTKFYAGDICFEVNEQTYVSSADIFSCIRENGKGSFRSIGKIKLDFGGDLHILPFETENEGTFYIGFSQSLKEKEWHNLYIALSEDEGTKRNPVTDPLSFVPLVDIEMEYYSAGQWKKIQCKDDTYGFLYSGNIRFMLSEQHDKCDIDGNEAYFIRFRLCGGEYDTLPVIHSIDFPLLLLTQLDTKSEYIDLLPSDTLTVHTELAEKGDSKVYLRGDDGLYTLAASFSKQTEPVRGDVIYTVSGAEKAEGIRIVNMEHDFYVRSEIGYGLGLPFQEYDLETKDIEYDSFTLMTEIPDSGGKFAQWEKVNDFSTAKPEDLVYVLDSQKGKVIFGDCIRGAAPEGRIFIIGCALTRGAEGNVSVGKINSTSDLNDDEIIIFNRRRTVGGIDEETIEECCERAHNLLRNTETIVTERDCERYICGIQGLKIEKCQVIHEYDSQGDEPVISVAVKRCSNSGKVIPDERYLKNIMNALEKRRMLGMQFRIVKPEYTAVTVCADVTVTGDAIAVKKAILLRMEEHFEKMKDVFGIRAEHSLLYELIDKTEGVVSVKSLTMQSEGSGSRYTREGDLQMLPNVACYLSQADITVLNQ